jgi:hypothetical protein
VIFIILSLMIGGCHPKENHQVVEIVSVRKYYPQLLELALSWQDDAYLDCIWLYINMDDSEFMAEFFSPSKEYESLSVYLMRDGSFSKQIFIHEIRIYQHAPISESDWQIDSQDALNLILEKSNHDFIDFDHVTNYLKLERNYGVDDQPVVWHLALVYDLGEKSEHYYLDAVDGELLQLPQTTPTRITTFTP